MRWLMLFLILTGVVAWAKPPADAPRVVTVKALWLPPGLEAAIDTLYPEYAVVSERDYHDTPRPDWNPEDRRKVLRELRQELVENTMVAEVPWACWGDFDGDSLTDVALLLNRCPGSGASAEQPGEASKLVVFLQRAGGFFAAYPVVSGRER